MSPLLRSPGFQLGPVWFLVQSNSGCATWTVEDELICCSNIDSN